MKMPQDFVDAINAAIRELNPESTRRLVGGSMSLGQEFDEWVGLEALRRYKLGPLPAEAQRAFEEKFAEKRDELKASIVARHVEVEKRRMAGTLGPPHLWNDSNLNPTKQVS